MQHEASLSSFIHQKLRWELWLISGQNPQGLAIYCFLAVKNHKAEACEQAMQHADFVPEAHGTVIGRGYGRTAPPLYQLEIIDQFESGEFLPQH